MLSTAGWTQHSPDRFFSDHMVLQRDKPIPVWGRAVPGAEVTVELAGLRRSTRVNPDSSWQLLLPSQPANSIPQTMRIATAGDTTVLRDILIGDLWLCIGQSNMEWPLNRERHFQQQTDALHDPDQPIRMLQPTYAGKHIYGEAFSDSVLSRLTPQEFYHGSWTRADQDILPHWSAVAWYFANHVVRSTGVPVGIIQLSIGGAPLETFVNPQALAADNSFADKMQGDWLANQSMPVWARQRARENLSGAVHPHADAQGPHHAYKPGFAYHSGIVPLLHQPIRGILCYQGESNAQEMQRVLEYEKLFSLMVRDYRRQWRQPDLPVYFAQLSAIDTLQYKSQLWPAFREQQRLISRRLRNAYMAVTLDVGAPNDVHPTDKKTVGERLARLALKHTYGQQLMASGPEPVRARYSRGKVRLHFTQAGGALQTSDGEKLRGFALDDGVPAEALIKGREVLLSAPRKPDFVTYAWQPFPEANLVNSERLPAGTFRIRVR